MLKSCRGKATSDDLRSFLLNLPQSSDGSSLDPAHIQMACEALLQLGSRSFSHFLNATERYIDVLRFLTPDPSGRRILLESVASYWRHAGQMRLITIDKYLQYGILEGLDVVDWVFADDAKGGSGGDEGDGWTDGEKWEVLKMMLDKLVGRVVSVRKRLRAVEKDDENVRARRAAEKFESGEGVGMDEDVEEGRFENQIRNEAI
jgi:nuclear cap-binding protein subunit 1